MPLIRTTLRKSLLSAECVVGAPKPLILSVAAVIAQRFYNSARIKKIIHLPGGQAAPDMELRGLAANPYNAMAEAEISLQRIDRALALAAIATRIYALLALGLLLSDMRS